MAYCEVDERYNNTNIFAVSKNEMVVNMMSKYFKGFNMNYVFSTKYDDIEIQNSVLLKDTKNYKDKTFKQIMAAVIERTYDKVDYYGVL